MGERLGAPAAPLLAVVLAAVLSLSVAVPAAASRHVPAAGPVPYQYVAKVYTELLGRAPDPAGWRWAVHLLEARGCDTASLEAVADHVLAGREYRADYPPGPASAPAIVLTLYRLVLNHDPDAAEFVLARDVLASGGVTPIEAAHRLFSSLEFAWVTEPAICSPTDPSYGSGEPGHPGQYPAIDTPTTGAPGPDAPGALLQLALDGLAAHGGGTWTLPARQVVSLTTTLVVPPGVTLTTEGAPGPRRYADMAHLVRSPFFTPPPDMFDQAELVRLDGGARLLHVWVDGQRPAPDASNFTQFDIRMMGGDGTTVADDRLSDPDGASALEADDNVSGIPGAQACRHDVVSGNLVDGYGTSHVVPAGDPGDHPQSDGLGIYCADTTVTGNDIVDASDTGIAVFDGATYLASTEVQHSLVARNVIVSAGNSYSFGIAIDPGFSLGGDGHPGGDPPGVTTRAFDGPAGRTMVEDNRLWTGGRTHIDVLLSAGSHDLFGSTVHQDCVLPDRVTGGAACGGGRNATGPALVGNGDAGLGARVEMGIYVGGTSGTLVADDRFAALTEVTGGGCPKAAVVVAVGPERRSFAAGVRIGIADARDRTLRSDLCVTPAY